MRKAEVMFPGAMMVTRMVEIELTPKIEDLQTHTLLFLTNKEKNSFRVLPSLLLCVCETDV